MASFAESSRAPTRSALFVKTAKKDSQILPFISPIIKKNP